jgi:hypothetical protein
MLPTILPTSVLNRKMPGMSMPLRYACGCGGGGWWVVAAVAVVVGVRGC